MFCVELQLCMPVRKGHFPPFKPSPRGWKPQLIEGEGERDPQNLQPQSRWDTRHLAARSPHEPRSRVLALCPRASAGR